MDRPFEDAEEFAGALPARGALLGIDPGEKTIGIAICDAGWRIASPLIGLKKAKFKENGPAIAKICADNAVAGLVIGLPLNMDGTGGPKAQAARAFARNLLGLLNLPILLWDNGKLKEIEDAMVKSQIAPNAVVARNPDFLALARAYGARAEEPGSLAELQAVVVRALQAKGPTVIRMTSDLVAG